MHILFLGNSYTHRGPIPLLVQHIAHSTAQPCAVYAHAPEAATLCDHLMSDEVEHTIRFGAWDALVLQEHSTHLLPSGDPQASTEHTLALARLFHTHNPHGTLHLVQTWARHPDFMSWTHDPSTRFYPHTIASPQTMTHTIHTALKHTAQSIHNTLPNLPTNILPIGDVWLQFHQTHPTTHLHDPDGSHANSNGQWLTAYCMYFSLFHPHPHNPPHAFQANLERFARTHIQPPPQ